ncbi:hypothetical protein K491DRAFT_689191 [Lophiostoma macrostomum CBS 122681]|uniref:Cyclin-dependent kinase n=1 Tax=Lophiostoma macrostomum CBS 122681 TaxID=1314788 RepID=A0A6A6TK44_9PLEO|nr:hypothetical protein K491DRAFT_689191 [Lophiostoma macrostomum CBS 122681]
MNNASHHPTNISQLYKRELPDSQESYVSAASSTFAAPLLLSSSSNVSNSTAADTDFTSPSTSNAASSQSQPLERAVPPSPSQLRGQNRHPAPPPIDTSKPLRTGDTAASPMSLDSPAFVQGAKRTASGMVKNAGLTVDSPTAPTAGHKRTKSTESGSNTRIGELSAKLRTRLSYAMVKVENGWERQSLEEIEDMASQQGSPISAQGRMEGTRPSFDSPQTADRRRRPSAISDNSDQIMLSPGQSTPSDASRSHAATPSSFWRSIPRAQMNAPLLPVTSNASGPVLAPAAEIGSRRKRRSSASFAPPPLLGSAQRKYYSDLGAGAAPRTPTATPRAGILRMPSQQAEKDAVDTLLFMSSPNNSGRLPHGNMDSPAQPSPLRSEMPARRVMFENNPPKNNINHHPHPVQRNAAQQATYFRKDSTR